MTGFVPLAEEGQNTYKRAVPKVLFYETFLFPTTFADHMIYNI